MRLLVAVPPTIIPGRTTHVQTVKESANVTLKCDADGYPKPNITWVRANGRPLPHPINKFRQKVCDSCMCLKYKAGVR